MQQERLPVVILGGGVTGLAAGIASGCPVYEREAFAGGICASYYVRRGSPQRLSAPPPDGEAFRFEHGGGHWIFGGHPDVLSIVERLTPCERITRRSSVYFPADGRHVGFPLQHHLHQLAPDVAARALAEMESASPSDTRTMAEWLDHQFGPTLGALFFRPFHEAYTAGLWRDIAPQDGYKTPLDLRQVRQGAAGVTVPAGYNATFLYPRDGLDTLMRALTAQADVRHGYSITRIDPAARRLTFADGQTVAYERVLSTLPLNRMLQLTGLAASAPEAPHTSVLVLNIGARRGPRCPPDHWLYLPHTDCGFHRVGFYSNVAQHFLPASDRGRDTATCLYVERSYRGSIRPDADEVARYAAAVVKALQGWGFVGDVDVLDPSWVDIAYTWNAPGSPWVKEALAVLAGHGIRMAGRYARWNFQGITDSLRDGFLAGQALRMEA